MLAWSLLAAYVWHCEARKGAYSRQMWQATYYWLPYDLSRSWSREAATILLGLRSFRLQDPGMEACSHRAGATEFSK